MENDSKEVDKIMYEIKIKINDIIANMNIEELEDLKEILEQFKQIDEFNMKYVEDKPKQR